MNNKNSNTKKNRTEFTELNEKYEELLKTQNLKDELVVMLVHDLKSPLSSLMENLKVSYREIGQLLKQLSEKKKSPGSVHFEKYCSSLSKQLNYLTTANSDAQLLWRRVTNLLDIKKMEESQMHMELSEFHINPLIDEAVSDMEMMANLHHVNLDVNKLDEDVEVFSDYDLVLRVLTNLLSNAIKHSGKELEGKGSVSLTVKDEGDLLQFEVLDSGHGVPEGFQKLLFEKYTQLKRIKGSTGLGLTFSKLAVETLQGEIASKNIQNHGALFHFSISKKYKQKNPVEDTAGLEQWEFE
tara:strand:- start:528 stop:1418 length:891 start_codon:yes stop_codon:yes gene_type:complete